MALANCVQHVLCGLSAGVRSALVVLIKGYINQLQVYETLITARRAYLNILTAPIAIAKNVVDGVITQAKAGANIIPLDLIGDCFEVGQLNESIQANLNLVLVDANILATDLERLLSFGDELDAILVDVNSTIQFYESIIAAIDVCAAAEAAANALTRNVKI